MHVKTLKDIIFAWTVFLPNNLSVHWFPSRNEFFSRNIITIIWQFLPVVVVALYLQESHDISKTFWVLLDWMNNHQNLARAMNRDFARLRSRTIIWIPFDTCLSVEPTANQLISYCLLSFQNHYNLSFSSHFWEAVRLAAANWVHAITLCCIEFQQHRGWKRINVR